MSRSRSMLGIRAAAAVAVLVSCGASLQAETPHRKLAQFRVSISGLNATIDPAAPVVPKGIASGLDVIVRAGEQPLSAAQAMALLGAGFEVNAELSGPGLNQVITLPVKGPDGTRQPTRCCCPCPRFRSRGTTRSRTCASCPVDARCLSWSRAR